MKKVIVGAAIAATALVGSGGAAFAGEITGQGRGTPILAEHGPSDRVGNVDVVASACSFSGLEDTGDPGETQTPKGAGAFTGIACRGPAEGAIRP